MGLSGGRVKDCHVRPAALPAGALDGDALREGNPLARGLYDAMLRIRGAGDIPEKDFKQYATWREPTLTQAEEIWKRRDTMGNVFVSFVKSCAMPQATEPTTASTEARQFFYVAVTLEDQKSLSHPLLFSFPTTDTNLLDRYRQGEFIESEDVVQESSH